MNLLTNIFYIQYCVNQAPINQEHIDLRQLQFYYQFVRYCIDIFMERIRCPICKKQPVQPINLKCEHHLCFACAQNILAVQKQSQLQTKYRVICPSCRVKTITYDLRHLIISLTEQGQQEQEVFVTCKYLEKKPQVKVIKKQTNPFFQSDKAFAKSQPQSKRNSIQSIASNIEVQVKCREHPLQNIKYFCDDCFNNNCEALICNECAKSHVNSKHKMLNLRQALEKVAATNQKNKNNIDSRFSQIINAGEVWNYCRQTIFHDYEKLENQINEEFNKIFRKLEKKHEQITQKLKTQCQQDIEQISQYLSKNKIIIETYSQLKMASLKDVESNYHFFSHFQNLQLHARHLIAKNPPLVPSLVKRTNQFQVLIERIVDICESNQKEAQKTCRNFMSGAYRSQNNSSRNLQMQNNSNYASQNHSRSNSNHGINVTHLNSMNSINLNLTASNFNNTYNCQGNTSFKEKDINNFFSSNNNGKQMKNNPVSMNVSNSNSTHEIKRQRRNSNLQRDVWKVIKENVKPITPTNIHLDLKKLIA